MCVEDIACNISVVFLRHSVLLSISLTQLLAMFYLDTKWNGRAMRDTQTNSRISLKTPRRL